MEGPPGDHMFPDPSLDPEGLCDGGGGPPGLPKPPDAIPDFLPSAQRALYLRIQQKQQEEEERARRLAESSKQERDAEEGKWPNLGQNQAKPTKKVGRGLSTAPHRGEVVLLV